MMRIGIVNDVRMIAEALRRIITASGHEVAWVAHDGSEAVNKCLGDTPDVILMDLLMPVMDGVEATRRIMAQTPSAILIVTANKEGNSTEVFKAMAHGALDVVNTPSMDPAQTGPLLEKIRTIGMLIGRRPSREERTDPGHIMGPSDLPPLVAIAASTGGPGAVAQVLSQLKNHKAAAIIVIQHVDVQFSRGLAAWLGDQSKIPVRVVEEGERAVRGSALIAGTNDHLELTDSLALRYRSDPLDNPYRPSADVFFKSVAKNWPAAGTAVVLTGMGTDGAEGLLELKNAGWSTIAQDRATSVIYGMPKAAAQCGAADQILPLNEIAAAIDASIATGAARRATRGAT